LPFLKAAGPKKSQTDTEIRVTSLSSHIPVEIQVQITTVCWMYSVICAAPLLSPLAGVRRGAAEFLGISALDLILGQVLKGSLEIWKKNAGSDCTVRYSPAP